MSTHALSRSTRTLELAQVLQINDCLHRSEDAGPGLTAGPLGLDGTTARGAAIDRVAARVLPLPRPREDAAVLSPQARLRRVLAAGPPTAPYLYGVFAEDAAGRRELPVVLHTDQLRRISGQLGLRSHRWGI